MPSWFFPEAPALLCLKQAQDLEMLPLAPVSLIRWVPGGVPSTYPETTGAIDLLQGSLIIMSCCAVC